MIRARSHRGRLDRQAEDAIVEVAHHHDEVVPNDDGIAARNAGGQPFSSRLAK
jgi:hypothetical protein